MEIFSKYLLLLKILYIADIYGSRHYGGMIKVHTDTGLFSDIKLLKTSLIRL